MKVMANVPDIVEEIKQKNAKFIIEGVCALAVMKRLRIKCDIHIYVNRMSDDGFWMDRHLYDVDQDVDSFMISNHR